MLITPEQKSPISESKCDNYRSTAQQHNEIMDISSNISTLRSSLDNLNLQDNDSDRIRENRPISQHLNTSSSSLNDIENSNARMYEKSPTLQRMKVKLPPHINLLSERKSSPSNVRRALFISDDVTGENNRSPSPMSVSPSSQGTSFTFPPQENDKYELMAGRLHLIRHTGNASPSNSPSSPSRGTLKTFPFQMSANTFSPSSLSPPLPSSPTLTSKRKMPVYMRVYKCNMDHFALVSKDSSQSSKHVYLNMRHSRVIPGECLGRFIIAGKCDSGSLMEFETSDLSSLEKWLDALQNGSPPSSPIRKAGSGSCGSSGSNSSSGCGTPIHKSPAMPTLAETDEEN